MKSPFLILFWFSVVKAAFFDPIHDIDSEIERLRASLEANIPVHHGERQNILNVVVKRGNHGQLKSVLDSLYVAPPLVSANDEPVKPTVVFDFRSLKRLEMSRKACRDLAEKGFEIKIHIEDYTPVILERDSSLFDELQGFGCFDVNDLMLQSARYSRIDLVFYFISRGADINYIPEFEGCSSSVLYRAIIRPQYYDFERIKTLLNAGAEADIHCGDKFLSAAIDFGREDVARILLNQKIPCPLLWGKFTRIENWSLIPDALNNGYEPSLHIRLKTVKLAMYNHNFRLASLLLNVPPNEEKRAVSYALELLNNMDRSEVRNEQARQDLTLLDELLTQRALRIQNEATKANKT